MPNPKELLNEPLSEWLSFFPQIGYEIHGTLRSVAREHDLSQRQAILLWMLYAHGKPDGNRLRITTGRLVELFKAWYVASPPSARSAVTRVKKQLYEKNLIYEQGRTVFLQADGMAVLRRILVGVEHRVLQRTGRLSENQKTQFWHLVRNIYRPRKPAGRSKTPLEEEESVA